MTIRTSWRGKREDLAEAERYLTELIDPPVDAASLVPDDDVTVDPADGNWILHAYSEKGLSKIILRTLQETIGMPDTEVLEERDWVAHALEGLGIVTAGPFVLFGRHDSGRVADVPGIHLQIEANRAFGTGHHPTTAGCLEAIGTLRGQGPARMLDLGTGSGVLAIAARKLWPDTVIVATDIDAPSIDIAREHAQMNAVGDITWEVANGTQCAAILEHAPFDLIVANILAGPLIDLASQVSSLLTPSGTLIVAGLLHEQEEPVASAYLAHGLRVVERCGEDRWPTLILQRRGAA